MTHATQSFHNRVALVFDFDDTLAPDSFGALLERLGHDADKFKRERVEPLLEKGWDESLARFYRLLELSKEDNAPTITEEFLEGIGRDISLFEGVPEMFDRVRKAARAVVPDVTVEFYLLSAGILEIARGTAIADEFKQMWGCEFHYGDNGAYSFVKQIVTHPEKTRYLLQLSKGLGAQEEGVHPSDVYRDVPQEELYIPLSQVIYLGDGSSDMPAFSLLNEHGGIALGLVKGDTDAWEGYEKMHAGRRVENLAPVDYRENSELMRSIILSVEGVCKQIALRKLSQGE